MNRILHVMFLEKKFTLPLYNHILKNPDLINHHFLILDQDLILHPYDPDRVILLKSPLRKNLFSNLWKFYLECKEADVIVAHAAPLSFFFILFPQFIKKIRWFIHGGIDIPISRDMNVGIKNKIDTHFKKKIPYHVTHIMEDSDLVNKVLNTNAKFLYSPMYLSNIADTKNFDPPSLEARVNVMVGNSTDPSNNHFELFDIIYPHLPLINKIYCILSYGIYNEYKETVIIKGNEMFGNKFVPVENFMPINLYNEFLKNIDIVVFSHRRQQAMGVTINLLALGKVVYMNTNSTAFSSFVKRGFSVFNIDELNYVNINHTRDVLANKALIEKYYCIDELDEFLVNL